MTPAASTAKGAATRERLLDVAAAQLAERGRIEIAAVAGAAGISQSALYRYFDGRDGLVAAVVSSFYDAYDSEVFDRTDVPGTTWMTREALRLEREVAFFYGHRLGAAVACGLLREPAAAAVDAARSRRHAIAAGRNIAAGRRAGELPSGMDAALAGAAIMGAVRAMLADALGRPTPPPQDEIAAAARAVGLSLLGR